MLKLGQIGVGYWAPNLLQNLVANFNCEVKTVPDGYTAITKEAIDVIDWSKAWQKYGYPMDFLIRMNGF